MRGQNLSAYARLLLQSHVDDHVTATTRLAEKYGLTPEEAAEHIASAVEQLEDGVAGADHPHNTDTGNAARLVEAFGDCIRYLFEGRGGMWLAWDGKRWAPDATGAVERLAKRTVRRLYAVAAKIEDDDDRGRAIKWALASESASRLEALMRLARSDKKIVVMADDLDADTWKLNVSNGIVDLRTGELLPHASAAMQSKIAAAGLDRDAPTPLWDAFLERVLPDADVREFVRKLVGYSLTGEVGENVLPFAYGSGANGKSVFLGVLREILGSYATEAAPDLLVARRERGIPVDVADLQGYRFVTAVEAEAGRRMATDIMKQITGEARLKARKMRQNFESFRNVTTLWMAANDRPEVDGLDEAIWRRVRLIPFPVTISEELRDPQLIMKLLAERDGIMAWAIDGCLAWQREGLRSPAAVLAATKEYRDESNPLSEWVEARCELHPEALTSGGDLRQDYERWCVSTRSRKVPRGTKWVAALSRLGCHRPNGDERAVIDGKQVRAWQGIRLSTDEPSI